MFFDSVYDGLYYLNINDTVRYLTVFHSKESYEYFTQNGRILYSVGQGYKRTSGHPSGHQYFLKQILLNSKYQSDYPVFRIFSDAVEYMGNYRLLSYKKKMSFEGFMYYEYKLFINSVYIPRSSENDIESIVYSLRSTPKPEAPIATPLAAPKASPKAAPKAALIAAPKAAPVAVVKTGTNWFPMCTV